MTETATATTRWESVEKWSVTAFLVAGGLFLLNTVYEGIGRFTALWEVGFLGAVFYLSALVGMLIGLLGLYPRLADRTPKLARASAAVAAVAAVSTIALLLWASITQLLNQAFPPGILLFATVALIVLGVLLFCAATLRTGVPSRTVGALLLVFVVAWFGGLGAAIGVYGGNSPDWLAVFLNGASFVVLLAIGYHLRTESVSVDRTESAPGPTTK